ncbi:hypothetical protein M514_27510, partial [Trichuris suis]
MQFASEDVVNERFWVTVPVENLSDVQSNLHYPYLCNPNPLLSESAAENNRPTVCPKPMEPLLGMFTEAGQHLTILNLRPVDEGFVLIEKVIQSLE